METVEARLAVFGENPSRLRDRWPNDISQTNKNEGQKVECAKLRALKKAGYTLARARANGSALTADRRRYARF